MWEKVGYFSGFTPYLAHLRSHAGVRPVALHEKGAAAREIFSRYR